MTGFRLARLVPGLLLLLLGSLPDRAWAGVEVRIHLAAQTMTVAVDGIDQATWPVSTARPGYRTPIGRYQPYSLQAMHYSKLYDDTPMPYSIFFRRGYAIHGTTEVRRLGRPVSHGCVRLSPDNARVLFDLIASHGMQNTEIVISR